MLKYIHSIILLLLICQIYCMSNPSKFSQQLESILPNQVTLLHQDIGTTVNGYTIIAYGITAIPGVSKNFQIKDFHYYSSSVIISYMHGTDQVAVDLLHRYAINLLINYKNDYYIETVLKTGFVWFIPFLSIDTYNQFIKKSNKQLSTTNPSIQQNNMKLKVKSMNKQKQKNQQIDCQSKYNGKQSGVNLNYNFLEQYGQQFNNVCSQNYAGPTPFSQKQSLAIKQFFQTLTIKAVIDLQSGQNQWIYPNKSIWNQNHKYFYLYKDILNKINTKTKYKISQQPKSISQSNKVTGGFINWACLQGSLAFKYQISYDKKSQKSHKAFSQAFAVMDMIIKKNAPAYNKYLSIDKKILYIESICLNQFTVQLQILIQFGQAATKNYVIPSGQIVKLSLQPLAITADRISQTYRSQPKYHLYVLNSLIAQVLDIDSIILVPSQILSKISNNTQSQSVENTSTLIKLQIIVAMCLLILAGLLVLLVVYLMNKKKHIQHRTHIKNYQLISGDSNL